LSLCCLAFQLGSLEKAAAADGSLKTGAQKAGYALGMSLGNTLKKDSFSVDVDLLRKAVKTQLTGATALMTTDEVNAVLMTLSSRGLTNLPSGEKRFKTVKEEIGYAIGCDFGRSLKAMGLESADLDLDDLIKGVQDITAGKATLLTPDEANDAFAVIQDKVAQKQAALRMAQDPQFKAESEKNLKEQTEFMAKNKTAPGVITLTNGLQYTVLTKGTGKVKVNYRGTFLDGREFDASPPGMPLSCRLSGGVIRGWLDVLKKMPAGSKWKVVIPSSLAYGPLGHTGIPPNAALIFEMELVSIDTPVAPGAGGR
jgi:FKBP-type peptidyl-prolyl cis-trans isomerase